MHVQRGCEPEQGRRSVARPRRPASLRLLLALTIAAGAASVALSVAAAELGWLPDLAEAADGP